MLLIVYNPIKAVQVVINKTLCSLTVAGQTTCSALSSCLKPVAIASTTTINKLFTAAR